MWAEKDAILKRSRPVSGKKDRSDFVCACTSAAETCGLIVEMFEGRAGHTANFRCGRNTKIMRAASTQVAQYAAGGGATPTVLRRCREMRAVCPQAGISQAPDLFQGHKTRNGRPS